MKRTVITTIITIALMILIGHSYALATPPPPHKKYVKNTSIPCSQMENQAAAEECYDKKVLESEKEVESAYFNATMIAEEGSAEKENLIENQRMWKVNKALGLEILKTRNGVQGYGRIEMKKYQIGINQQRTKELKFMYASPEDPPVEFP